MIEIRHQFDVDGARDRIWQIVGDIDAFARCVPTLIEHEVLGPDRATGIVGVTLGAIPVRSRVDIEVVERRPPEQLRGRAVSYLGDTIATQLRKSGQPGSLPRDAVGHIEILLELESVGPERTRLLFRCDIEAQGKLERIYQSIIRLKAEALKQELERNVRTALARAIAAPIAAVGTEPAGLSEPRTAPASSPGFEDSRRRSHSLVQRILRAIWRRIIRRVLGSSS